MTPRGDVRSGRHDAGFIAWVAKHPLGGFVVLAFGLSWVPFILAALGGGAPLIIVGAFGPAAAGCLVTRWTGGSVRAFLRPAWRWRVPARFYLYALGLPPLIIIVTEGVLAMFGEEVPLGSAGRVVPEYVGTVVLVALLGGGQEEPGWRGFALDRYQARHQPLVATALLGLVWGAWHLPVYGIGGFAGPVLFVVFYTWLYNRTGSVLLCVLLHASFNTAIGYLKLGEASGAVWLVFVTVAVTAGILLVTATRGHLGVPNDRRLVSA